MKSLFITLPAVASMFFTGIVHAACSSGTNPMTAASLLEQSYPAYYHASENWDSGEPLKIETRSELAEYKAKVDRLEDSFTRYQKDLVGCLSPDANALLIDRIAHMELKDGKPVYSGRHSPEQFEKYITWKQSGAAATPVENIESGKEYVSKALKLVTEIRAAYPQIDANIAKRQERLEQKRLAAEMENKQLEEKLAKEKEATKELQRELEKKRQLEASLRAEQEKKAAIQRQLAQPASPPKTSGSSSSGSVSQYIKKPAGSESFNSGLNNTREGDGYIKKHRVICFSKSAHDRQVEMLVDGIKEFAPGCYSTPENQNAWMRDYSWGECEVQRVSDNKRIWTDCGDFVYW